MPTIHLTFDDGPADSTVPILDALAEHGGKGTFFQVGRDVGARPEITRRVHADGHAVGNHSWSHPNLRTDVDEEGVLRELSETSDVVERVIGVRPSLFRPPYGQPWGREDGTDAVERRRVVKEHAAILGMTVVLWHVDTNDWHEDERSPEDIAAQVVDEARSGAVILLHDIWPRTAAAVPLILRELGGQGYSFEQVPAGSALLPEP
jgi:peptidoglycan/xylan/chitin deacetylase (PgdA/CDA1 family)